MNEDILTNLMEIIGIFALLSSLTIFTVIIYSEIKRDKKPVSSHSLFITLLLTCWLIVEFLSRSILGLESTLEKLIHSFILMTLAIWMNIRFFWANRKARETIQFELTNLVE